MVTPERSLTTLWFMRIACWIAKDTNTYSEYYYLLFFQGNSGCTNAPLCYVCSYTASFVHF